MSGEDNASGNGHGEASAEGYSLLIVWNPATGEFTMNGLLLGPVLCIGMLEYALMMVKRRDVVAQVQAAASRGPSLVDPYGGRR